MKNLWRVYFETYTEESLENGESADRGLVYEGASLREAIDEAGGLYASYEPDSYPANGVRWLTNDRAGACAWNEEAESRSLHIPDQITEASRRRLMRLLGVRSGL